LSSRGAPSSLTAVSRLLRFRVMLKDSRFSARCRYSPVEVVKRPRSPRSPPAEECGPGLGASLPSGRIGAERGRMPIGSPVDMSTGRRRDASSARARGADVFGGPLRCPPEPTGIPTGSTNLWETRLLDADATPNRWHRIDAAHKYRILRLPPAGRAPTRHSGARSQGHVFCRPLWSARKLHSSRET
jgi:hypothetical protein